VNGRETLHRQLSFTEEESFEERVPLSFQIAADFDKLGNSHGAFHLSISTGGHLIPDHSHKSVEFEGTINQYGNIVVPQAVLDDFGLKSRGKVHIRLTRRMISTKLRERRVNEEEIERIAITQLESHDQVVKFLLSEGALRNSKGILRRLTRLGNGATQ
jgi:hypothetical protein